MPHLDVYYGCALYIQTDNNKKCKVGIASNSKGYFLGAAPSLDSLTSGNQATLTIKLPRNGPKKGKIFESQLGTFPVCGGRKKKRKMLGSCSPSFSAYFFCQGAGLKIKRLYGPFRARLRIPKKFQRLRRQGLPEDLLYKGQATQNRKFPTLNCNLPNRQTHPPLAALL